MRGWGGEDYEGEEKVGIEGGEGREKVRKAGRKGEEEGEKERYGETR